MQNAEVQQDVSSRPAPTMDQRGMGEDTDNEEWKAREAVPHCQQPF